MGKKLIRFDWAIKKILRHKANFAILEGFLSELFGFDVTIETLLESEGNQSRADDKSNRVDMLVRTGSGELVLVEVQNDAQIDYFHRMIYGSSKLVTEYIDQGEPYAKVKKVFSVNIVYFDLGQGGDYVYEYQGNFVGRHRKDTLLPSTRQRDSYRIATVADLFPKYYILKVNNFDDVAHNTLDEWIYFLKNSEVPERFKAKGLKEAGERLKEEGLSTPEKRAYRRYQDNLRIEKSVLETAINDGREEGMKEGLKEGLEKGRQEGMKEVAQNMHAKGLSLPQIAELMALSEEEVAQLLPGQPEE